MKIVVIGGLCALSLIGASTSHYFAEDLGASSQKIFERKTQVVAEKPLTPPEVTKVSMTKKTEKKKTSKHKKTESSNRKKQQSIKSPTHKPTPSKAEKKKSLPKEATTHQSKANTTAQTKVTPSTTSDHLSEIEKEVARLVNLEREKRGLQPLTISTQISDIARKKSNDMKIHNYFDHQSPTYGSPFEMLNRFGVSYNSAGENIAAGQRTAQEVMNGWMNSEGHRANILNPSFTHIGVGSVTGGNYGIYWTQLFISK